MSETNDVFIVAFIKGDERYLFTYGENTKMLALKTLGRFASDPELSFTWYDAALLSQRIRNGQPERRHRAINSILDPPPESPA